MNASKTTQSPPGRGAGTIYPQRRRTDEQHFVMTDFEPDQLVTIRTVPPAGDLQMRFTFEPHRGGTRLTGDWTLDAGLPRWLERIGASRVGSAVRANLAKLKELPGTGRVRLQDGRAEAVSS
jgi:Polyketide cyclase / dehydrase and lipid transport